MTRSTRRAFVKTAAVLSTAAAWPQPGAAQSRPRRSPAFAGVRDIEESQRRIPSEKYPLPFTQQEYDDRAKRCRQAMQKLGIDVLLVTWPEGICYLHGYEVTWYRTYWTPTITTAIHVDRDKLIFYGGEDPVPAAVTDRRRNTAGRDPRDQAKFIIDDLSKGGWIKDGTRVGLEFDSYLPTPKVSRLLETACIGRGARVVDGSAVMRTVRNVKSPAEIAVMEHATRIADIGHRAIADTFRPGMSHLEVYAAAWYAMNVAGGEIAGIQQGVLPADPPSIHLLPSRRQIKAGEPFAFDLCGVYKRYHSNIARTFIYGDPPPELRKLDEAARGAFEVLAQTAKAGTPVAVVNRTLRRYYQDHELRPSGIGYEVGIAFPPDWVGHFIFRPTEENPEGVFEANSVTQYETTFRATVGQRPMLATHIDTFVYEPKGARRLSAIPLDLVVLGS